MFAHVWSRELKTQYRRRRKHQRYVFENGLYISKVSEAHTVLKIRPQNVVTRGYENTRL